MVISKCIKGTKTHCDLSPALIAHVNGLLVRLHDPLPAEGLAAIFALERLLALVLEHVNLEDELNVEAWHDCRSIDKLTFT